MRGAAKVKNIVDEEVYLDCLKQELIPAMGCTEPISIAYASAYARDVLGNEPEKIEVHVSGNILKNVKGVIVPNTNGLKGVKAAAVIGMLGGNAKKGMEVLADVQPNHISRCTELLKNQDICTVRLLPSKAKLHIILMAYSGNNKVLVELKNKHTNIIRVEKNGEVVFTGDYAEDKTASRDNPECKMTLRGIYDFACNVSLDKIAPIIKQQIECNLSIAEEGLLNNYGLSVGKTMLESFGNSPEVKACAYAAAASDARMGGCTMPVVINSGSGNQGVAVSLPVIVYAKYLNSSEEKLIRALALSNLTALYQKAAIGRLSAYCGAVSAACGSGAGIAFLQDASFDCIGWTIKNTLANVAGMVCDGAKASCAAKIFSSVQAALLGYKLAQSGRVVQGGDGIVLDDVDSTVKNYGKLANDGMRETDQKILELMI